MAFLNLELNLGDVATLGLKPGLDLIYGRGLIMEEIMSLLDLCLMCGLGI